METSTPTKMSLKGRSYSKGDVIYYITDIIKHPKKATLLWEHPYSGEIQTKEDHDWLCEDEILKIFEDCRSAYLYQISELKSIKDDKMSIYDNLLLSTNNK
jgi:hypothetical protein